jgi:hypothetical protein
METLGSELVMPKNLLGHRVEVTHVRKRRFQDGDWWAKVSLIWHGHVSNLEEFGSMVGMSFIGYEHPFST